MKPIHILLVEDTDGDILLINEAFEEARIINNISKVKDGESTIHFLSQSGDYKDATPADLILFDANLPKKNGHEVLKFIKNEPDHPKTPVIMLTTSSSEKDIYASFKSHLSCYITKPKKLMNL